MEISKIQVKNIFFLLYSNCHYYYIHNTLLNAQIVWIATYSNYSIWLILRLVKIQIIYFKRNGSKRWLVEHWTRGQATPPYLGSLSVRVMS